MKRELIAILLKLAAVLVYSFFILPAFFHRMDPLTDPYWQVIMFPALGEIIWGVLFGTLFYRLIDPSKVRMISILLPLIVALLLSNYWTLANMGVILGNTSVTNAAPCFAAISGAEISVTVYVAIEKMRIKRSYKG